MRIELFAGFGSPDGLTPDRIWTTGVGGAELAMMQWAETMCGRGHELTVYNDPRKPGNFARNGGEVAYRMRHEFNPNADHDVVIAFRGPLGRSSNQLFGRPNCRKFVFWSCDQYTYGNYATDLFPQVDNTIVISPRHATYFEEKYGYKKSQVLDLGVVARDYEKMVERDPNQLIYCSVPDRGLEVLFAAWPRIRALKPDAHLVITSDYRLWGSLDPQNQRHVAMWIYQPHVDFLGAIKREELIKQQLKSSVQSYPCTYDEMFCVATAECQVAGAIPVTARIGAIPTTQMGGWIMEQFDGTAEWLESFAHHVVAQMATPESQRQALRDFAIKRFDWNVICAQWEAILNG